jgi:hypothetical protein
MATPDLQGPTATATIDVMAADYRISSAGTWLRSIGGKEMRKIKVWGRWSLGANKRIEMGLMAGLLPQPSAVFIRSLTHCR